MRKKQGFSAKLVDSLHSMLTKLGNKSRARRYGVFKRLPFNLLWTLYNSSWVVRKHVDKTALDMTKKWREIKSNDFTPQELALFSEEEDKLNFQENAELALAWTSLFGDCLVFAVTDIADELLEQPLNLGQEEIIRFLVIDPRGFNFDSGDKNIDDDVRSDNFNNPIIYTIKKGEDLKVHHTRVHRMRAGKALFSSNDRSGTSDFQGAFNTIKMFDTVSTAVSDLIEESKVDVLSVKGMNAQISAGKEENVLKYAEVASYSKSQSNMLLVDADDTYDQKEIGFSGLADIWVKAGNVLAAALDRPLTVLFGQSANGFSSGEEDSQSYYDTINSLQESRLRPLLDFMDKFIFDRMKKIPKDWSYDFPTLDVINEREEAQRLQAFSGAVVPLLQLGTLKDSQVLSEMKQKGLMENITDEDIKESQSMTGELDGTEPDFRAQQQAYY